MKKFWTEERLKQYYKASKFVNYPMCAVGDELKMVKHSDSVLDIGAGLGMASLAIAPNCKMVTAVERDIDALEKLNSLSAQMGIGNIHTICADWHDIDGQFDVVIALNVGGFNDKKSIEKLLSLTKREGIILTSHPWGMRELHNAIAKELAIKGFEGDCSNGCQELGMLKYNEAKVKCRCAEYDFSQNVDDEEEAARFMIWQLRIDESYLAEMKKIIGKYLLKRGNELYLPIVRKSCAITFKK